MTSFDANNSDEFELYERSFWSALETTLSSVFDTEAGIASAYKEQLSDASPYERLLALHDDPLDIASKLTGIAITPAIELRYDLLVATSNPQHVSLAFPREVLGRVIAAPPVAKALTPPLPLARTSGLVSLPKLQDILRSLGFEYAGEFEGTMQWHATTTPRGARLPPIIAAESSFYRTSHGYSAVSTDDVLQLFTFLRTSAQVNEAPANTYELIDRIEKQFREEFGI